MRETKNMRKYAPASPVGENDNSKNRQHNPPQRELFGKDRLKPLRTAPPPKQQRVVKKPAAITGPDLGKTTRSLPKAKTDCS